MAESVTEVWKSQSTHYGDKVYLSGGQFFLDFDLRCFLPMKKLELSFSIQNRYEVQWAFILKAFSIWIRWYSHMVQKGMQ